MRLTALLILLQPLCGQQIDTNVLQAALQPTANVDGAGAVTLWVRTVRNTGGQARAASLEVITTAEFTRLPASSGRIVPGEFHLHSIHKPHSTPAFRLFLQSADGTGTNGRATLLLPESAMAQHEALAEFLADPAQFYIDIHQTPGEDGLRGTPEPAESTNYLALLLPENGNARGQAHLEVIRSNQITLALISATLFAPNTPVTPVAIHLRDPQSGTPDLLRIPAAIASTTWNDEAGLSAFRYLPPDTFDPTTLLASLETENLTLQGPLRLAESTTYRALLIPPGDAPGTNNTITSQLAVHFTTSQDAVEAAHLTLTYHSSGIGVGTSLTPHIHAPDTPGPILFDWGNQPALFAPGITTTSLPVFDSPNPRQQTLNRLARISDLIATPSTFLLDLEHFSPRLTPLVQGKLEVQQP